MVSAKQTATNRRGIRWILKIAVMRAPPDGAIKGGAANFGNSDDLPTGYSLGGSGRLLFWDGLGWRNYPAEAARRCH